MAKAGRAAQALATAAIGSFVAGTIGTALLVVCAPIVVEVRGQPRRPELLRRSWCWPCSPSPPCSGSSRLRGFASLGLGLAIGLVGIDSVTGQPRLTFGHAAAGRRHRHRRGRRRPSSPSARPCGSPRTCAARRCRSSRSASPGWASEDWKRSWKPWLRGTAFGFPFGALPAGGAEIPTFLSYVTEKRLSKHPEEFGKGAIEGVAGPGGGQQRLGRGHPGPDAGPGPADQRHRGGHAGRVHRSTASSPARCCSTNEPDRWSGR